MKNITNKTKQWGKKAFRNPIKIALIAGLVGLVSMTAAKDNVHFGSTSLYNPKGDHYTWGLFPNTTVKGDKIQGNFHTFGLYAGNKLDQGTELDGNMSAYGLIAVNKLEKGTELDGNMSAYSVPFCAINEVEDSTKVTGNMSAYCLGIALNEIGEDSEIHAKMNAYSVLAGANRAGENSTVTGDVCSRGLMAENFVSGFKLGSNQHIGLENYVVEADSTGEKIK